MNKLCQELGCNDSVGPKGAHGFCRDHYMKRYREKRKHEPKETISRLERKVKQLAREESKCAAPECEFLVGPGGRRYPRDGPAYCKNHYNQARRGEPFRRTRQKTNLSIEFHKEYVCFANKRRNHDTLPVPLSWLHPNMQRAFKSFLEYPGPAPANISNAELHREYPALGYDENVRKRSLQWLSPQDHKDADNIKRLEARGYRVIKPLDIR